MIVNFIKIALRNFYRNKSITLIKILGLALGLAVTFFILIYVSTETSYNDYNKKKERIFRINQFNNIHGWKSENTSFPMKEALLEEFPVIEEATRIISLNDIKVSIDERKFENNQMLCVDKSFFEIFTMPLISGDLSQMNLDYNVVLTESFARKVFGSTDIIGKAFTMISGEDEFQLNVVAIVKDIPTTSTLTADFFTNIELGLNQANKRMFWSDGKERDPEFYRDNWSTNFLQTYVLFDKSNKNIEFEKELKVLEQKYLEDTTERDFYIQNLEDIYLHSGDMFGSDRLGDLKSLYIFSAIAFLVLLIACINYIILTISQVLTRSKEIGIRKIIGANRTNLLKQASVESIILILVTVPLAFVLIEQFRPSLEQIIDKKILLVYNTKFVVGFILIIFFVIFFPAMNTVYFLNRITPLTILKKEAIRSKQGFNFRKVLITFQYIIFIVLVVVAIGIKRQIDFSIHGDLGFNPENKLVLEVGEIVKSGKYSMLKNELLKSPEVENISGAMWLPPSNSRMSFSYQDTSAGDMTIKLEALFVDKDFIENFEIELIEGKSFNEFENPDWKVLVNESTAEMLGKETILGKTIWNGEVVGIVKDFRFHSVHEKVQPMMLVVGEHMIREMVVRFHNNLNQEKLVGIKDQINSLFPEMKADPEYLTDRFDNLYKKEKRLGVLLSVFSFLAIFIASIGLLGLTIFTTKKESKNIAIRKVNGASSFIIWKLLIRGYVRLIAMALIIAVPISYYILEKWLQSFAYRTMVEWWIFIAAGVLALIISLLTVSWYSLKASRRNPVVSLRYE